MKLSEAQIELLKQIGTDPERGLSADEASERREKSGFNTVTPPINCPPSICCLLPCIKHVPSMKAFSRIKPEDAEVLRDGRWTRYDATSLVQGDIIRLEEGDIVPADCIVLALEESSSSTELLVDHRLVTGEEKPRGSNHDGNNMKPTQLFWGGQVVQGSAIAVATAVGESTLVAAMIREGKFPPREDLLAAGDMVVTSGPDGEASHDPDEEVGISLITRDEL
jgi:magnesium-transporting ATPase (P-type)